MATVFFPIWTQHTVQGCTLFVEIKFLNSQLGSSLASLLSMAIFAQAVPKHLYSSKERRVDSFESLPLSQQDFSDLDTLASLYQPPGHKEHTLAPGKEQGAGLWLCKPATTLCLLRAPNLAPSPSTLNEAKGKCFLEPDTLQRQAFLSEQKNLPATVCCVEKHGTSHNLSIKIGMSKLYSSVCVGGLLISFGGCVRGFVCSFCPYPLNETTLARPKYFSNHKETAL